MGRGRSAGVPEVHQLPDRVVTELFDTVAMPVPLLALLGDSYERNGPAFLETLADIVLDGLVRLPAPISAQTPPPGDNGGC